MVTVSILSGFSIWVDGPYVYLGVGGEGALSANFSAAILPSAIPALLAGDVVTGVQETICLTKNRLVVTGGNTCAVVIFPVALLKEFIEQLDGLDEEIPPHAPGGG